MEVKIAKTAGFCFGVKRAVDKVYEVANDENVYTYGPIIHNEEVVSDLESKGVKILDSVEDINKISEGTVVIRSHGVDKSVYDAINSNNLMLVDATCPFVLKIHRIVEKDSLENREIIIIGNKEHPEVQGIMGWCNNEPIVVENRDDAEELTCENRRKVSIVSQTTFN